MAEIPLTDQVTTEREGREDAYDPQKGEQLASWIFGLLDHYAAARKQATREKSWDADWAFLRGKQWEGPLPTYKRPIVSNIWRRAYHISLATITGGRPTLKIVPQGTLPDSDLKVWQDALWALLKKEAVIEQKLPDAYGWAWIGEGGWFKIGYGTRSHLESEQADVMVSAPHPAKVYPDSDCTDLSLTECAAVIYRDKLDLGVIADRYPEQGWRVRPDGDVSLPWLSEAPNWVKAGRATESGYGVIAPSGGWRSSKDYRRAMATVLEYWTDDSARETVIQQEIVNLPALLERFVRQALGASNGLEDRLRLLALQRAPLLDTYQQARPWLSQRFGSFDFTPEVRDVPRWRKRFPYGRLVTCSRDVILRDIPNPFGPAWGWGARWPFVYVPGAHQPGCLWRPGLLANKEETQRAINKGLSLLLENFHKVTNAMVIADENAMEDEDWDLLTLVPGVKIRKRPQTEVKVQFPEPLPAHAFQYPDYMGKKLEEEVGLHDPPIAPGQAVAAKTVAFLQQKGSFLLGIVAKLGDEALERLGQRIVGLQRARYLPGRMIPYFEGEKIVGTKPLPELPASLQIRVEATSAVQEIMMTMFSMAQAEAQARRGGRRG